MPRALLAAAAAGLSTLLAGCGGTTTDPGTFKSEGGHGHAHDRGTVMLADLGKRHHAGLTAHLSAAGGNALDLVIETAGKDPKPAPLPLKTVAAKARRANDPAEYDLVFEPVPADERKGDPEGQCSRFSAKAPWLKPDDTLSVTATIPVDGKPHRVEWADFVPKKYAHAAE